MPPVIESQPTAETIREKAAEVISRDIFQGENVAPDISWLSEIWLRVLSWLLIPLEWLFRVTAGLPGIIRWPLFIGLLVLLVLVVAHIIHTFVKAFSRSSRVAGPSLAESRKQRLDPLTLERLAEEARDKGDFITGIRLLFKACVVRIEVWEKRPLRPGTTNRELLAKYRARPELYQDLSSMVETIDRKWYGDEECTAVDYAQCQAAQRRARELVEKRVHAHVA